MQPLMNLQRFLAVNRKQVTTVFFIVELLILAVWGFVFFRILSDFEQLFSFMYNLGLWFGKAGVIFYVITLIPGIITRLQFQPKITQPITSIILPFRRHFGILMFLSIFVHMSFTTFLPHFALGEFREITMPPLMSFQVMGLTAWLLLFPMWLTSNDFSQKGLGKNWKRLHRLTYLALIFIFLHVALQKVYWMYVVGPTLILEVLSWIVYWRREAQKPKVAVVLQQPAATTPPVNPPQSNT